MKNDELHHRPAGLRENAVWQIRDATPADLPAIVDIYNSTIPSRQVTADLEPVPVETRRAWFAEHSPDRRPVWVALEEGRVVGWLSYSDYLTRPAYAATSEVSIYLAPAARGRGLGTLLVRRCLAHAPALGITHLVGLIFGHNAPSLRLFEQHGFARWGCLPGIARLDGVERDLVIVGRRV